MSSIQDIPAQDLEGHRWKDRVLLLCTTTLEHPEYLEQVRELQRDMPGLRERKLVVYTLLKDRYGQGLPAGKWKEYTEVTGRREACSNEFHLELKGLDGATKMRRESSVPREDLWNLIDRMPMRRAEVQKGSKN